MNLIQIRYVLEIASCKNFTEAAKNLCVTQPAISHQITTLERELDCKLFTRNTHGIALTTDGKRFCYYGEKILKDLKDLESSFGIGNGVMDRLHVGLYPFHRATNLIKPIFEFISEYNVKISSRNVETIDAIKLLLDKQLDFAIVSIWGNFIPSTLEYVPLTKERLTALLPRANPHTKKKSISITEFNNIPILFDKTAPKLYDTFSEICSRHNVILHSASIDPEDLETEIAAVELGLGASIMKESTGRYCSTEKLIALPIEPEIYLNTVILYRKKVNQSRVERLFINHIKNFAKNEMLFAVSDDEGDS